MLPPSSPEPASLHGSLDSFPLADVLALLASTGNTGALDVTGDGGSGRVFVDGGAVVAAADGRQSSPLDVVVELLRLEDGSFTFEPDEAPDHPGPPLPVPALLAEARARLDEWYAIEAVLPSVDHLISLVPAAPAPEVVLTAARWRAVAVVGDGGPIGLLLRRLAEDELDAMRMLKELVDAGLARVDDPAARARPAGEQGFGGDEDDDEDEDEDGAPLQGDREVPVLVVVQEAAPPPRVVGDPALTARLDALAIQFDALYEVAQGAAAEDVEVPEHRTGLLAKLRHRHPG